MRGVKQQASAQRYTAMRQDTRLMGRVLKQDVAAVGAAAAPAKRACRYAQAMRPRAMMLWRRVYARVLRCVTNSARYAACLPRVL